MSSLQEICELGSLIKAHEIKKAFFTKRLAALDNAIHNQNNLLLLEVNDYNGLQDEQSRLADKSNDLHADVDVFSATVKQLSQKVSNPAQANDEIIQELVKEQEELLRQVESIGSELNALSSRLSESAYHQLKQKREHLAKQQLLFVELKHTAHENSCTMRQEQEEQANCQEKLRATQWELDASNSRLIDVQARLDELTSLLDKELLNRELLRSTASDELEALQIGVNELYREASRLQVIISSCQSEMESVSISIEENQRFLQQQIHTSATSQVRQEECRATIHKQTARLQEMQERRNQVDLAMKQTTNELVILRSSNLDLKQQHSVSATLTQLENSRREMIANIAAAKKDLSAAVDEIDCVRALCCLTSGERSSKDNDESSIFPFPSSWNPTQTVVMNLLSELAAISKSKEELWTQIERDITCFDDIAFNKLPAATQEALQLEQAVEQQQRSFDDVCHLQQSQQEQVERNSANLQETALLLQESAAVHASIDEVASFLVACDADIARAKEALTAIQAKALKEQRILHELTVLKEKEYFAVNVEAGLETRRKSAAVIATKQQVEELKKALSEEDRQFQTLHAEEETRFRSKHSILLKKMRTISDSNNDNKEKEKENVVSSHITASARAASTAATGPKMKQSTRSSREVFKDISNKR